MLLEGVNQTLGVPVDVEWTNQSGWKHGESPKGVLTAAACMGPASEDGYPH